MTFPELKVASYIMNVLSNGDKNYEEISLQKLNLNNKNDTSTLLTFLNAWGCRQFIKKDHSQAANNFKKWFNNFETTLPPHTTSLMNHSDKKIREYATMFDELMNSPASTDKRGVIKNVGPVGAAKALFALRKNTFPPWDNPIIDHLGYSKNGSGYTEYLIYVKDEILKLKLHCDKINVDIGEISKILNRPNITMVKLIDEYLWLTITRKFDPKAIIELIK